MLAFCAFDTANMAVALASVGEQRGVIVVNTALCAAFCACLAADRRRRRGGRAREAGRQLRPCDRAAAEATTHAAAAPVKQTPQPAPPF